MSMPAAETQPKKKRMTFKMPDAYVLLFMIAFICAIASYIVPAGEFDRVTKGDVTTAVPGSYHSIEQSPVSLISFFTSLQDGMVGSAPIIFLILFTGDHCYSRKNGAINGLIYNVISKFHTKQLLFICIVGALFSILGTTGIVVNSVIGFIPIGLIVARSLKWDAVAEPLLYTSVATLDLTPPYYHRHRSVYHNQSRSSLFFLESACEL